MTDKVQKIREEVEKRYEYWKEKESNSHSIESDIRMSECQHLLLILDSLQEEPVSEDLEEAAHLYVDTTIEYFDSEGSPCCYSAFIAGAQWQKEQMIDKACEWLREHKEHPFIGCEDPCLSGYLTDEFIEDFKKAMEK